MPLSIELAIERDRRFVKPDFDHRQIRCGWLQVVAEREPRDRLFSIAEFLEAAPEMNDHQIALVPNC